MLGKDLGKDLRNILITSQKTSKKCFILEVFEIS